MRIKLVDPVASLRSKGRGKGRKLTREQIKKMQAAPNPRCTGHRNNPFGIGGAKKGEVRNPTGKGGLGNRNKTAASVAKLKGAMIRAKKLPREASQRYQQKQKAKSVAMEARELQEIAKRSMHAALDRINHIISDPRSQDHHAIAAAVFLADRAYGKAIQPNLNASVNDNGNSSEVSDAELTKRINETLERITAITGGKGKPPKGQK